MTNLQPENDRILAKYQDAIDDGLRDHAARKMDGKTKQQRINERFGA